MTDRYSHLTVVLDKDVRADDAQDLIKAVMMLRGVLSVTPGIVSISADHVAQERARLKLGEQLLAIVFPKTKE